MVALFSVFRTVDIHCEQGPKLTGKNKKIKRLIKTLCCPCFLFKVTTTTTHLISGLSNRTSSSVFTSLPTCVFPTAVFGKRRGPCCVRRPIEAFALYGNHRFICRCTCYSFFSTRRLSSISDFATAAVHVSSFHSG